MALPLVRVRETERKIRQIYDLLFERFGPQYWWPAKTPFEVVIGAVLTQNTSWKNVERAIMNLEKAGRLSLGGVLGCKDLAELIHPSGYYNVKAQRLTSLCEWIEDSGGLEAMFDLPIGELRVRLISVKGIGEETADSIILYAAKKPTFVIDAYTRRIMSRIGLIAGGESYSEIQRLFMRNLPKDVRLFNEYHALLVELGKTICTKRAQECGSCPLKKVCGYASGR